MKPDIVFSRSERGKFFHQNVELRLPIYLESEVQTYLAERAARKGRSLTEMVNGLLKQEVEMMESVK